MSRLKIDVHSHSILSYDGGLSEEEFLEVIENKLLDYIAITDHNEIDFALMMQAKYGDCFIVGEEILTKEGEIIGLFLKEKIKKGMSLRATINAIKSQNGIVHIPHPFDTRRKALGEENLLSILDDIDVLEIYNQRTFNKKYNHEGQKWAKQNHILTSAGSDAHSMGEIGRTYNLIDEKPTRENFLTLLHGTEIVEGSINIHGIFAPLLNKLQKQFFRSNEEL